jgi:hypothetical protein
MVLLTSDPVTVRSTTRGTAALAGCPDNVHKKGRNLHFW